MLFLATGYFASQAAALFGDPFAYHRAVDVPTVKYLAMAFLIGVIVLGCIPEREKEGDSEGA
jgi:hypothetical protein